MLTLLNQWVATDAPRSDADNNGFDDSPGPAIMDGVWPGIADAVMSPVFDSSSLLTDLNSIRGLGGDAGQSYVDKDLRRLLGEPVVGPFHLQYCGNGSPSVCRSSLWSAFNAAVSQLETTYGPNPSTWLEAASCTVSRPD